MKVFIILAALVAFASAQTGYGAPSFSQPAYQNNGGYQQQQQEQHQPQVFKHVYVHTAPDEPEDRQARVVRVPGGDKHVNIIFVKTPSSSSSQQTEVILPEQDEHKNLVYVLLKKGSASSDIKIRRPSAKAPTKPDVYFIRYGDAAKQGYSGGASAAPAHAPTPVRAPSSQYGF